MYVGCSWVANAVYVECPMVPWSVRGVYVWGIRAYVGRPWGARGVPLGRSWFVYVVSVNHPQFVRAVPVGCPCGDCGVSMVFV